MHQYCMDSVDTVFPTVFSDNLAIPTKLVIIGILTTKFRHDEII